MSRLLFETSSRYVRVLVVMLAWLHLVTAFDVNDTAAFDLTGHHFIVTGIVEPGFLETDASGTEWEGYIYEMLSAVARAANFTFEMRPPSGVGSLCGHGGDVDPFTHYGQRYRTQYTCGQSDVNDQELRGTRFASDMYIGLYWITPDRLKKSLFSTAFKPPLSGAMTMFGVATGVSSLEDLIEQQKLGLQKPICIPQGAATVDFMRDSYPELEITEFVASPSYDLYTSMALGDCDIHVVDYPIATRFILNQYNDNACTVQGNKPFGIIGSPLSFGYSQYGIGIRNDMPQDVVHAIDYWLTELMTCVPEDPECDSLAAYYTGGGTGEECGYSSSSEEDKSLSAGGITGIALAQAVVTLLLCALCAKRSLDNQRRILRKRVVEHVAHYIVLCPNSYDLDPDLQLAEFDRFLQRNGRAISKDAMRWWMLDKKLYYLTDRDFDALWGALDIDKRNTVDPEEFIEYMVTDWLGTKRAVVLSAQVSIKKKWEATGKVAPFISSLFEQTPSQEHSPVTILLQVYKQTIARIGYTLLATMNRPLVSSSCRLLALAIVWLGLVGASAASRSAQFDLTGHHFIVTGVDEPGFLTPDPSGTEWEGYFYDMISALSRAANFTFEMRPPSGLGSLCEHGSDVDPFTQYGQGYRTQYTCAQSDVNDEQLRGTRFASDMYIGLFWITPDRLKDNLFSTTFKPPASGAMSMYGVATGVSSIEDVIEQQKQGLQKPICISQGTATVTFMRESYPELEITEFVATPTYDVYLSMKSGDCDIHIADYPIATKYIYDQYKDDACMAQGKPIGIIGSPLSFGYSQYGIGIRNDMPQDVVHAIDYWLTELMTCIPEDPECDSLAAYYTGGGTGEECGYSSSVGGDKKSLSTGWIAGIAVVPTVAALVVCALCAKRSLDNQRRKLRRRAVEHVAHYIILCPNSYDLDPDLQVAEFERFLRKHRRAISKESMRGWMMDKKLYYLADRDFEALWGALDIDQRNMVDPAEFIEYMGICGPDSDRLNAELHWLPKKERLAWISRRLSSLESGFKSHHHVRKLSASSAHDDNEVPTETVRVQADVKGLEATASEVSPVSSVASNV
eukprot:Nitzschia sp. Nitz4//scaffold15_size197535//83649//88038//NITZ4_001578-RA/size197535-augustus-gene-0.208-mRNA-1//1//CDS//3329537715//9038//frame0